MTEVGSTRSPRPGVFSRFIVLGVGSLGINLAIVTCLCEVFGAAAGVAGGFSYGVVLVVNFVLARRFVFESKAAIVPEAARFSVAQAVTRIGEYGAFLLLTYAFHVHYFLAVVIVGTAFFVIKFSVYRVLVFRGG